MNVKNFISSTMLSLIVILTSTAVYAGEAEPAAQVLYPTATQESFEGPEKYFTGEVMVQMLFPKTKTTPFSGAYVTFQPGARTAWHLHPAGQHMIVTNGTALTGTRDGKVIAFHEGETVWCPAGIDHWHGATPDAAMTHLVITGSKGDQNVIWKEKVNAEVYLAAVNKVSKGKTTTMNTDKTNNALSLKEQALIPISAFTASGDLKDLQTAVNAGLDAGLTVNEVKEVMVHLYAYTGFPRSLNALGTLLSVVNERKANGINDTTGKDATPLPAGTDPLKLGIEVQTELAGGPVTGPLFDFAPIINEYLQSHLFGDIFGRDVLTRQERELVTVAALSNMEGVEPQLKAHLGIAQNTGVTMAQLEALKEIFEQKVGKMKYNLIK